MALNISGIVDPELFLPVNSAVHAILFAVFTLPTIIMVGVLVLALLLAKAIHLEMRVVLVNVLAAEICYLVSHALYIWATPLEHGMVTRMIFHALSPSVSSFFIFLQISLVSCSVPSWCIVLSSMGRRNRIGV